MKTAQQGHAYSSRTRTYAALFLVWVALVLLFSDRGRIEGDGIPRWEALDTLLTTGRLTADKYSIAQPLMAAPLYWAGDLHARTLGSTPEEREHIIRHWVQRFNKLMAFFLVLWLYLLLRRAAGWSPGPSLLAAGFFLFGSLLIPHARDFYSECLWTLLSVVSLTLFCSRHDTPSARPDIRMATALFLCTLLTIPLNPLLLPVWGMLVAGVSIPRFLDATAGSVRERFVRVMKPDVLLTGIAACAGAGLTLLENRIRRGAPLDFGYPGEGFSAPFREGFIGQLGSPTRGVIFFIPVFFCGFILYGRYRDRLSPTLRRLTGVSLLFCIFLVPAYSKWHAWHGAWYWGPRFLLPLSVFGTLYFVLLVRMAWPAGGAWARAGLIALVACSYMIYKAGVGIGHEPLMECLQQYPDSDFCYWQWRFLPQAAWFNLHDLEKMLTHRSTAVEAVSAVLLILLLRYGPEDAGETTPPTPLH